MMRAMRPVFATVTAALMLGACSQTAALLPAPGPVASKGTSPVTTSSTTPSNAELAKATQYWGEQYAKNSSDRQTALNFARNLKAMGDKQKCYQVLQQASTLYPGDPEIAGEVGRLALDLEQYDLAAAQLAIADVPSRPDWRVLSARGTLAAKNGQYQEAIPFYERALALAPSQPSILNNLALAHAMRGDPKKAEELLRQASAGAGASSSAKVRQNLALVLGLQGRYEEQKAVAAADLGADQANANSELVRKIVRLEPKADPASPSAFKTVVARAPQAAPAAPKVAAAAPASGPGLKGAAIDNTAPGTWNTDVAANQPKPAAAPGLALKGSSR